MISECNIVTELRNGRTILQESYCTQPFKIANITEDKRAAQLQLMIMTASPGLLDGDDHRFDLKLLEGANLKLENQCYQRLYHMKIGASQQMNIRLSKGAHLTFIQHPCVPHEAASFKTKNTIYLQNDCSLIWGEILTSGRAGSGESFIFSKVHSLTEIYINQKITIRENILMEPKINSSAGIGLLEGFTHQATLFFLDEEKDMAVLRKMVYEKLAPLNTIEFGVSIAPVNGIILRILGYKAEQLFNILKSIGVMLEAEQSSGG